MLSVCDAPRNVFEIYTGRSASVAAAAAAATAAAAAAAAVTALPSLLAPLDRE